MQVPALWLHPPLLCMYLLIITSPLLWHTTSYYSCIISLVWYVLVHLLTVIDCYPLPAHGRAEKLSTVLSMERASCKPANEMHSRG